MPKYKGMEDREHFLPVDVFLAMTRRDPFGEDTATVNPADTFDTAGVGRCVMIDARQTDNGDGGPRGKEVEPPSDVLPRRGWYPSSHEAVPRLVAPE
jgi:hypothetical protein